MIKVCHVTSVHPSWDVRIFPKMCASLARAGYDVWLVAPGESREEQGVHVIGVGEKPASRIQRMTRFAGKVFDAARQVDAQIYHLHDPELLPYGLRLKRRGKTVIFDSHEDTVEEMREKPIIPPWLRPLFYRLYKPYHNFVCTRLDGIITVTPNVWERMKQQFKRVVMVSNFPITGESTWTPPKDWPRRMLYAGGISESWSHDLILQAMESLSNVKYLLCGRFTTDAYEQKLRGMPAWEQVEFKGHRPHGEISGLLAEGGIGMAVLQYLHNTDGRNGTLGNTKLFEYMLAGLPVVCTDFVLWQEIVDTYQCGICVDPTDGRQVAQAIARLLDNPEEARRMGENGRRAVLERYNWGTEEKKLLALYEELLTQGENG